MNDCRVDVDKDVWAFACELNGKMTGCKELAKPEYGKLEMEMFKDRYVRQMKFVPYAKDGGLIRSRAVLSYNRRYAYTKEEAIRLYNEEVDRQISIVNNKIEELKSLTETLALYKINTESEEK